MREDFKFDYYRMTGKHWSISGWLNFLFMQNIRYMYYWRKRKSAPGSVIAKIFCYLMSRKYGLEISAHADIGHGLYLGHAYNITVAGGVKLGKNCNLHKGCTIGCENRGKRKGAPTLGNCVSVGINAVVVGKIFIGNDVMIAPNSFVNFDVPDHSVVLGNPGVIHRKEYATKDYIAFQV